MKILLTGGSGFIGVNIINYLIQKGYQVINIDIKSPPIENHNKYWIQCNILDFTHLKEIFDIVKPEIVVHLAARADVDGRSLDDYSVNTNGTSNVLRAIQSCKEVQRIIITSTQFVNQYSGIPQNDLDFAPHTIYGESKVITEKLTRESNLSCCWTIVRPTNIWGPWHWRYPNEFWKIVSKNKYFHPKGKTVVRSYGFVGNVAWQINRIIELPTEQVDKQVFYLGDRPIDILDWVNGFSIRQIGKKVHIVPSWIVKGIALIGEILNLFNIKFPITLSRYKSMTTSNTAPMEKTYNILGAPPYSLNQGIDQTIHWMKMYHPELIKISESKGNV